MMNTYGNGTQASDKVATLYDDYCAVHGGKPPYCWDDLDNWRTLRDWYEGGKKRPLLITRRATHGRQ